jgi:cyclophilin family peptidyl-prolyl cis-trans isomerase
MVNLGMKAGNGNIFRILGGGCPELDGKHTVFGKAID